MKFDMEKFLYFLVFNNLIYSVVGKYKFSKNPNEILPESSGFFYETVANDLFRYYKLIDN